MMTIEQFFYMAGLATFYYSGKDQTAMLFRNGALKINFLVTVSARSKTERRARLKSAHEAMK